MSVASDRVRAAVARRAGDRCEYCRLTTIGQAATFPLDHVVPRDHGGLTVLENLALACPVCNGHKWKHVEGTDKESGVSVMLFNPRVHDWSDHFVWSKSEIGVLLGRTAIGRATIDRLQMNAAEMVATRRVLAHLGLFPELVE
jgi:HNH endonuclease